MKICIVVGTRPEIIKMSPIIKECQKRAIDFDIIHSGQHFSDNMSGIFFEELGLPTPHISFDVMPGGHAQQLSSMLLSFDGVFSKFPYNIVLVQGDTNTVFAAAMMASRYQIPVGHVEAGLRSGDRSMPEEINRILVDHLSTYLFATSPETLSNLRGEGISESNMWNTGNTIVDATLQMIELVKQRRSKNEPFKNYILLTLHRPGNVDSPENLKEIIEGVQHVSDKYGLSVVFPVHPRTKTNLLNGGFKLSVNFHLLEPLGYLDFLRLQLDARLIMTDSGGIQEEACITQIPCVTLRNNTERPETVAVGANKLGGINYTTILKAADAMLESKKGSWKIPYGDGHSAEKIMDVITNASSLY